MRVYEVSVGNSHKFASNSLVDVKKRITSKLLKEGNLKVAMGEVAMGKFKRNKKSVKKK